MNSKKKIAVMREGDFTEFCTKELAKVQALANDYPELSQSDVFEINILILQTVRNLEHIYFDRLGEDK